jgi:hypothetical protein
MDLRRHAHVVGQAQSAQGRGELDASASPTAYPNRAQLKAASTSRLVKQWDGIGRCQNCPVHPCHAASQAASLCQLNADSRRHPLLRAKVINFDAQLGVGDVGCPGCHKRLLVDAGVRGAGGAGNGSCNRKGCSIDPGHHAGNRHCTHQYTIHCNESAAPPASACAERAARAQPRAPSGSISAHRRSLPSPGPCRSTSRRSGRWCRSVPTPSLSLSRTCEASGKGQRHSSAGPAMPARRSITRCFLGFSSGRWAPCEQGAKGAACRVAKTQRCESTFCSELF